MLRPDTQTAFTSLGLQAWLVVRRLRVQAATPSKEPEARRASGNSMGGRCSPDARRTSGSADGQGRQPQFSQAT